MTRSARRTSWAATLLRRPRSLILALVLGGTTLNGAANLIIEASGQPHHQRVVAQATERQEFWRIVAGAPQQRPGLTDQALASDLAAQLGATDPTATNLPAGVTTFVARSNADYGGITAAIGLDPFTNTGCFECGPLTASFQADLLTIKRGNVQSLITNTGKDITPTRYSLTPFGLSVWLTLVILGAIIAIVTGLDRRKQSSNRRKVQAELHAKYPRQISQLEKADALLAIEPPPGYDAHAIRNQVLGLRTQLASELERQADPAVSDNHERIADYEQQLASGLAELQDGINADRMTAKELGLDH